MNIAEAVIFGVLGNWLYWFLKTSSSPSIGNALMMWLCAIAYFVFVNWYKLWRTKQ